MKNSFDDLFDFNGDGQLDAAEQDAQFRFLDEMEEAARPEHDFSFADDLTDDFAEDSDDDLTEDPEVEL